MVSESRKGTMARWSSRNREYLRYKEAEIRDKLRENMVVAYGGECLHCGENDPVVLTLDHINNDPEPEYETCGSSSRGGWALYRKLKAQGWPKDRLQLLCFNCNMRKEHKRRRDEMNQVYGEKPKVHISSTRKEARAKAGPSSNNTSGFKGVLWDKIRLKWIARITIDGRLKVFGRFSDIRDAARAYREGVKKIYGDLATLPTDEEIEEIAAMRKLSLKTTINNPDDLGL